MVVTGINKGGGGKVGMNTGPQFHRQRLHTRGGKGIVVIPGTMNAAIGARTLVLVGAQRGGPDRRQSSGGGVGMLALIFVPTRLPNRARCHPVSPCSQGAAG